MHEAVAVLLCVLAVFGLYALFARVAFMLLPRGTFMISVDGRERTVEDILLLTERARLLSERERGFSLDVSVLLDEDQQEKAMTLRKEGILVYTRMP